MPRAIATATVLAGDAVMMITAIKPYRPRTKKRDDIRAICAVCARSDLSAGQPYGLAINATASCERWSAITAECRIENHQTGFQEV